MSKCLECGYYDKEKHYCPFYCQLIRETLDEAISFELEQTRAEIEDLLSSYGYLDMHTNDDVLGIIDKHIAELKGE